MHVALKSVYIDETTHLASAASNNTKAQGSRSTPETPRFQGLLIRTCLEQLDQILQRYIHACVLFPLKACSNQSHQHRQAPSPRKSTSRFGYYTVCKHLLNSLHDEPGYWMLWQHGSCHRWMVDVLGERQRRYLTAQRMLSPLSRAKLSAALADNAKTGSFARSASTVHPASIELSCLPSSLRVTGLECTGRSLQGRLVFRFEGLRGLSPNAAQNQKTSTSSESQLFLIRMWWYH